MKNKSFYQRLKKIGMAWHLCIVVFMIGSLSSCSSDEEDFTVSLDGPSISVSDFSGSWVATTAVFESTDGSQRLDVIQEGGSATLQVQNNGRFTITISAPGQGSDSFSGEMGFNGEEYGNQLIVLFDGDARDDYELFNVAVTNDDVLFLSGITAYDFTGSGGEVPATIDLVMVRA